MHAALSHDGDPRARRVDARRAWSRRLACWPELGDQRAPGRLEERVLSFYVPVDEPHKVEVPPAHEEIAREPG